MANRYWVGGSGTWDTSTTTHWSDTSGGSGGFSVPTSADDVFFDSNSNATAYSLTTATGILCNDLNISGPAAGNVTFSNTNFGIDIYGNLNMSSSGITWNLVSGIFTFKSTSGIKTINSNNNSLVNTITFNGVGGTWQLLSDYSTSSTRYCTVTAGNLDLNNYTMTAGVLSSSNTNQRGIFFGNSGKINLLGSNLIVLNFSTSSNLTLSGNTSINFNYSGSVGTRTLNIGSLSEANVPNISITNGSDSLSMTGTTVGSLNYTGFSGNVNNLTRTVYGDFILSPSMNIASGENVTTFGATSGTKTINLNGHTLDYPVIFQGGATYDFANAFNLNSTRTLTINNANINFKNGTVNSAGSFSIKGTTIIGSTSPGNTYTLSQSTGTVIANNMSISDCVATGGAVWNAYKFSGCNDNGNNTGWNFTTRLISKMFSLFM